MKQLTNQQYKLCINYVSNGFNMTKAARDAGYSVDYADTRAHKLLDKPEVKEHLAKSLSVAEQQVQELSKVWLWKIKKLVKVINKYIPDDDSLQMKSGNVRVAISALQELNKMHGDYAPERRLSLTVDATKEKLEQVRLQYKDY